jgi:hypothetical protein
VSRLARLLRAYGFDVLIGLAALETARTGRLACAGDRVRHEASGLQVVEPF